MTSYALPCSLELLCKGRFSILVSDNLHVPFWTLFEAIVQRPISSPGALVEILEEFAVARRGRPYSDYGFLKRFMLESAPTDFFERIWPCLVRTALRLPLLFPSHQLAILGENNPRLILDKDQVACLVVHQFLCTLTAPVWQDGYQDFHIWYYSDQPHEQAVRAYLTALFEYFSRLASANDHPPAINAAGKETGITFHLHTGIGGLAKANTRLSQLEILDIEEPTTSPDVLGLPDGAAVISANKFIGFGLTGTREETHIGASPECCPAVLVTPPLQDNQVLVVTGAEAMITITGDGEDARCTEVLPSNDSLGTHNYQWSRRTMLFMDALEQGFIVPGSALPDLESGNVLRELHKAYIAFCSHSIPSRPYSTIYTGYWGCRTFCGDPSVKTLIQWCAASLAACDLTFICSGPAQQAFGRRLQRFAQEVRQRGLDQAGMLVDVLMRMTPNSVGQHDTLTVVLANLHLEPASGSQGRQIDNGIALA